MIRRLPTSLLGSCLFAGMALFAAAQAPAPQPQAPLSQQQREAAAAIEAPQTSTPPPLPGQLESAVPAQPPAGLPPVPTDSGSNSASKMSALDALTQPPVMQQAPRVSSTADKLPVTSSTSTSRQFIVHGKVFETRSAMSSRCEEISAELRKVLNDKEAWVLPIIVLLNTGEEAAKYQGPIVHAAVTEIAHGGIHLQVTINERPGLNAANMREGIVRALLAERIVRNHQKITTPKGRLVLPDWIMTGVLHAMDYKASARPSAIFSTIFRSGKIYGIEEIIAASPVEMDGLSRTIYETSCCALVLALVDQPSGPQNFNKFLNALASDPRSERELLDLAFPKFAASASSLNKWWSLQLATLSKPGMAERFPAAESLKAIEDAIQIRFAAKPDEVPQNVKPRPFVLPSPLVMTAPPKPRQQASAPTPAPAPEPRERAERAPAPKPRGGTPQAPADTPPETAASTEPAEEEPKTKLWRRMLFLGAPKPDDTPAEAAPEESKPGFLGRLLGAGGGEKEEKPKAESEPPATKTVYLGTPGAEMARWEADRAKAAAERAKAEAEKPKADPAAEKLKAEQQLRAAAAEAEKAKAAAAEMAKAEAEKKAEDEKAKAAAEKPKPVYLGTPGAEMARWEAAKAKAAAGKPKAAAKAEPSQDEPKPAEEGKPSKLNPLNWFKGGKKPAEEPKEEEEPAEGQKKDKQAALLPAATPLDMARLLSPALADAWGMLAPAAPRQTVDVLNFLRRKPKAEEEAPAPPAPAPAPAPAKEKRKSSSSSSKPRTSNPNSKPASRPKPSTPDAPRTNNPNATPVPAAAAAAAGVIPAPAPAAGSGLVAVSLPLEEYKLILKRPDCDQILERSMADLRSLELRVSPLFRPVIMAYLTAFKDLKDGKTKDMDKRIGMLREFALLAYQKSIAVRDYLDYYEANESTSLSGKFDDFLNLPAIIQKELPPRTDPISKYLDAIDKEFSQ